MSRRARSCIRAADHDDRNADAVEPCEIGDAGDAEMRKQTLRTLEGRARLDQPVRPDSEFLASDLGMRHASLPPAPNGTRDRPNANIRAGPRPGSGIIHPPRLMSVPRDEPCGGVAGAG